MDEAGTTPSRGESDEVFLNLVARYLDGQLSPKEIAELNEQIRSSPQKGDLFTRFCLQGQLIAELFKVTDLGADQSPADETSQVLPRRRSPVLGFLHRAMRIGGESPEATALMWIVMAILLSGTVLTAVFVAMLVFGGKQPGGQQVAANNGNQPKSSSAARPAANLSGPVAETSSVARLIRMVDGRWDGADKAPKAGDDLMPGRKLVLNSGLAEIMFQSGARTLLEGPASLEIRSRKGVYLQQGKFTVTVLDPLVKGFEVRAPGMKYTDLGTEFGVSVSANGEQEMQVFRGMVQAEEMTDESSGTGNAEPASGPPQGVQSVTGSDGSHPPSPSSHKPPAVLSANQGLHVAAPDPSGKRPKQVERIAANDKQFVRTGQIEQIAGERTPEFALWKKNSDELCKRQDLVAYYDFQPDSSDRTVLRNRSTSGKKLDGRIEGAKWTDGRLPGKQALEFKGRDDRVRVDVPESLDAVTAVVWIRLDSLPNQGNSILMSDRWYERVGACHWQIVSDEARVDFEPCCTAKIAPDPPGFRTATRSPSLARRDFGAWTQLAVAYDSTAGTTTYYKNGEEIGTEKLSKNIPLVFGPSQIANWEPYKSVNPAHAVRHLPARISELYLYSRALPAKEIKRLYDNAVSAPGKLASRGMQGESKENK
jgi:hypothetical protein